jgi:hypothetical protein
MFKAHFQHFWGFKIQSHLGFIKIKHTLHYSSKIAPTQNNIHISQKLEIRLVDFYTMMLKPKNPKNEVAACIEYFGSKLFSQTMKYEQL